MLRRLCPSTPLPLLLLVPPSPTTLFPYTTLFRSAQSRLRFTGLTTRAAAGRQCLLPLRQSAATVLILQTDSLRQSPEPTGGLPASEEQTTKLESRQHVA